MQALTKLQKNFSARSFTSGMQSKFVPNYSKSQTQPADVCLSIVKPMGAKWMCDLYDYLKSKPDIIRNGFIATELLKL